jgi:hypothetical protein
VWDDYIECIEDKLARAVETSIAESLRDLLGLVTGFRATPMFKLRVTVTRDATITVGHDFDNICNFFLELPSSLGKAHSVLKHIRSDRIDFTMRTRP